MASRNLAETLTDRLLTLLLISESQKQGYRVTGKVKFLKLIYLSESKMIKDVLKGFDYDFYRWDYGPMSNDALKDLDWLSENDLLEKSRNGIFITSRGRELLKSSSSLLKLNEDFLEYIRKVVREFGPYTGKKIKTVVYGTPKMGDRKLISKTEHGEELLRKLPAKEAEKRFRIDDEWLETLSILMDKTTSDSLRKGIEDAKKGKVRKYEPLNGVFS